MAVPAAPHSSANLLQSKTLVWVCFARVAPSAQKPVTTTLVRASGAHTTAAALYVRLRRGSMLSLRLMLRLKVGLKGKVKVRVNPNLDLSLSLNVNLIKG